MTSRIARKTLSGVTALVTLLSLAACGTSDETTSDDPTVSSNGGK